MTACADIAVAVLAAGQGRRFGSNKLMADLGGLPLGLHIAQTLSEIRFGWRFAVCSKDAALLQNFSTAGFDIIVNESPETGQAHSLHLAVEAANATSAAALLLVLGDMPFVTAPHIQKLLAADDAVVASTAGKHAMPPALFRRDMWPQLMATSGDTGARDLLQTALLFAAPKAELRDIDVAADLRETPRQ